MKLRRTIRAVFQVLVRNPRRTLLTMLDIFIGIASLIVMLSIGNGSTRSIQQAVAGMGSNNLLILPGAASNAGVNLGMSTLMTLTAEDAQALLKCPAIRAASPLVRAQVQVSYGHKNWVPSDTLGATPAFLDVRNWNNLAEGIAFTDHDVRNTNKVCLLGQTVARELFEGESPIGKEIRIQNVAFKVIGVLSAKGSNMGGMDQDDILLAPWTAIKYRVINNPAAASASSSGPGSASQTYPNSALPLYPIPSSTETADTPQPVKFANVNLIVAAARSTQEIKPAIAQATALLRDHHRLRAGEASDFSIRDLAEMMGILIKISNTMSILLLCVASLALAVGGVGIMNIMLISVTQRTREIGLRMAIGGEPGDILRQFLIEAVVLCLAGGAVGISIGLLASHAIQVFKGWPMEISFTAVSLAAAAAGGVGILFGFYPAWKASRLDPIEALRYE